MSTSLQAPTRSKGQQAMQILLTASNSELRHLHVSENLDQSITITGQVSTYYLKQLAQEMIRKFTSGFRLLNEIEVLEVQVQPSAPN